MDTVQRLYQPWCVGTHQTRSVIAVIKPKEALSHFCRYDLEMRWDVPGGGGTHL